MIITKCIWTHNSHKTLPSLFDYLLIYLKSTARMANSVDPDQIVYLA